MADHLTIFCMPTEVRLRIYSYLFHNEWLYIDSSLPNSPPRQQQRQLQRRGPCVPPLLRTCRLVAIEASQAYYSNLHVYLDISTATRLHGFNNWLHKIGHVNVRHLRHINIRWENYVDISIDLARKPVFERHCGSQLYHGKSQCIVNYQNLNPSMSVPPRGCHARLPSFRAPLTPPPVAPAPMPFGAFQMPPARLDSKAMSPSASTSGLYSTGTKPTLAWIRRRSAMPPSRTHIGTKHRLAVKAVPQPTLDSPGDYWEANGTAQFCDMLSAHLFQILDTLLSNKERPHLTATDWVELIAELHDHATALRWLWYW